MSDIIIYDEHTVAFETTVENETIWSNQNQTEKLFGRENSVMCKICT